MSPYGSYQSPSGYDTATLPHIPSIANLNRQSYHHHHHDSNALPPMHMRTSNAPPFPSSLIRDGNDTHSQYGADHAQSHGASNLPHLASQHHNFSNSPSMANSQSQMYPPPANFAPMNQLPSYNNFSSPPSNQTYNQSSLPSVSSALYGQHPNGASIGSFGASNTSPTKPFPSDDGGMTNVAANRGRRDLLPNAGQPSLAASETANPAVSANLTGVKNADGKFPCTICNKTYQHQKHLKRHNLRHTGERPYRCHLCHETFCRSDILKRHFAKCSIRRGNPLGITHLTHAQDHLKKRPSESGQSNSELMAAPTMTGPESDLRARSGWVGANDGSSYSHLAAAPQHPPSTAVSAVIGGSNESSRSSSVLRPGSSGSGSEDKKHYAASHILPPIQATTLGSDGVPYSYDQLYPRSYAQQNHHGDQNGVYGNHGASGSHHSMTHEDAYPQQMTSGQYPPMSHVTGAGTNQWMGGSSFEHHGQEPLMFSGH